MTKKQRERLKAKFGGRCAYCGALLGDKWHADHMEPLVRKFHPHAVNGRLVPTGECFYPERDHEDNLMPACIPCNVHKGSYGIDGYRLMMTGVLGSLRKNSGNYKHALRYGLIQENDRSVVFFFETYVAEEIGRVKG